ncbi:MAG: CD1871A family CXXC motif-containing protein [Clostridia bacterium]
MGKKKTIGLIIIVIAAGMVGYGIFRDEITDVLNKAILICLECIGIGWIL